MRLPLSRSCPGHKARSLVLPIASVDWSVLDWNQSAIRFYQSLGAVAMDEWIGYRLSGDALAGVGLR